MYARERPSAVMVRRMYSPRSRSRSVSHNAHAIAADIKAGGDVSASRTGPDRARVSSVPHAEAQRVEHDGLSRTGFASDASHARVQVDLQVINHSVVLYREINEHFFRHPIMLPVIAQSHMAVNILIAHAAAKAGC